MNNDKSLSKSEYFELREKRLKMVYKILYAVIVIWIAILFNLSQNKLEKSSVPVCAFMLSSLSMMIIQMIKYAIMELRCLKINGSLSNDLVQQTENRYDNIWKFFSFILSLCGVLFVLHVKLIQKVIYSHFLTAFSVCMIYFFILSLIKIFKREFSNRTVEVFDLINTIVGSVSAYSLCAVACLLISN